MHNFILIALCLLSLQASAGADPQKVKKNLVGTWRFGQFWNPYKNDGEPGKKSTDPHDLYTAYTFNEDGRVVVWSLDTVQHKIARQTYTWGVVLIKDNRGKDHAVVKILEASIDPQKQEDIERSTSGLSFLIVQSKSSFLAWIKIPQYKQPNPRDTQSTFKKVSDMPPAE